MSWPLFLFLLLPAQEDAEADAWLEKLRGRESERREAVERLKSMGAAGLPGVLHALRGGGEGLEERVNEIVTRLSSPEWKVRDGAGRELASLGEGARKILEKLQKNSDPEVAWRIRAALAEMQKKEREREGVECARLAALCEILGEIGNDECLPDLIRLGGHPQGTIRLQAALALGRCGAGRPSPKAAEEIVACLIRILSEERDPRAQALLLRSLGRFPSPGAFEAIRRVALDSRQKDVSLRETAVRVLATLGTAEAWESVLEVLSDESPILRDASCEAVVGAAGSSFGFDPQKVPAGQEEALRKIRGWWEGKFQGKKPGP